MTIAIQQKKEGDPEQHDHVLNEEPGGLFWYVQRKRQESDVKSPKHLNTRYRNLNHFH